MNNYYKQEDCSAANRKTMNDTKVSKSKRLYFIEFLRIFLILSVFLVHIGDYVDTGLKNDICSFFHTKSWRLWWAVEVFFIIGGFFLYGKIAKSKAINIGSSIGKLWLRLMPGIIFCYLLLVLLGDRDWWMFPFCFFPAALYGFSGEVVPFGDWFIGVYFIVSCLFLSLFYVSRRSAWFWILTLMFLCWCLQINGKPTKGMGHGGMYFFFLAHGTVRGLSCMALGMLASYLSRRWSLRGGGIRMYRILATVIEGMALFMLFNYMFRPSCVYYSPIAVELMVAAMLISAAHSWGYISAFFNRLSGIMYISRYCYSILLAQGVLMTCFYFNHNFGLEARTCSLIIIGSAIPLVLLEYHFVEKWLVPKLVNYHMRGNTPPA